MKKSNFLFLVIVVLCSLFYPFTFVEAKEGVYTLNIAAELIEKDGKNLILAKGEANFPDNTQVNVRFRDGLEPEICYATKKVNIKSGRFECLLNLSDRKTLPGKYIVEARISPLRQARKDIVAILGPKGENIKEVTEGELEIDEQTQRRSVRAKFILRVGSDLEIEQVTKKEKDLLKELVIQLDSLYKDLRRQYALQQEEPQMNRWDSWSRTWLKKVEEVQKSFEAGYSKSVGFKFLN